jgi:GNAT superfamily N-acetyltransferase
LTAFSIRPASPDDAETLTDICFRAKAYWGYPVAWIKLWADELTITPEELERHFGFVSVDDAGVIIGFGILSTNPPTAEIEHLYIDPDAMGKGAGQALITVLKRAAAEQGCTTIELDSDPHALGFYQKTGGTQIGDTPSAILPGRSLPRVRIDITKTKFTEN